MSFLDVLDSIGTSQRPAAPQAQQGSNVTLGPPRPLTTPARAKLNSTLSLPTLNGTSDIPKGVKRKIDDTTFQVTADEPGQPAPKQEPTSALQERKADVKTSSQKKLQKLPARTASPASSATSAKIPPKGSYAALMAEAKAAQEQRAKSEVGQIKHQATAKERLSKSERRKREEEERALKTKLGKRPQHNSKVEKRAQSGAKARPESSYKGTAKPTPPASSYKGTAGRPSQFRPSSDPRHKSGKQPSRYDEYLGTDEDDEGIESDAGEIDDGYGSAASSDMEAGAMDVEEEESKALREARADDAKELALENKMKREKEERRRRLQALANKRR
jgi:hypothetical protein